ncbi:MAG: 50S ribosomal protein L28 [Rickettsiales bacterium]|jgi:large subunit ribosomal protein L28|nr:50S ribosomal protein L28 [Rickettsiales bacterium]
MSRKCELTGKTVLTGNNVSHSNRKSRRRYLPNLHRVTLMSDVLGSVRIRISARALKSVDMHGGLDSFLMSQPDKLLSLKASQLKKKIKLARAAKSTQEKAA